MSDNLKPKPGNQFDKNNNSLNLEINRTVSKHDHDIKRLNSNYMKLKNEVTKLKLNGIKRNFEFSMIKTLIELLKTQVKSQNKEIEKWKINFNKESTTKSSQVGIVKYQFIILLIMVYRYFQTEQSRQRIQALLYPNPLQFFSGKLVVFHVF